MNYNLKTLKSSSKEWSKPLRHEETLSSAAVKIEDYDCLVRAVAQIAHYNRNHALFFRGQSSDHKEKNQTTILPSIYRKSPDEKSVPLVKRFETLIEKSAMLRAELNGRNKKLAGTALLNKYEELRWAILQHYEVCPTPLLDITQSLHVACSFAFDRNKGKSGIIYVLGMPYPTDSISYSTYEELLNIKLLSICPPRAERPFFQEGYLAGPFPLSDLDKSTRKDQFDFARRLIAKFEIPMSPKFWGSGFSRIPSAKLYQEKDLVKEICEGLKDLSEGK